MPIVPHGKLLFMLTSNIPIYTYIDFFQSQNSPKEPIYRISLMQVMYSIWHSFTSFPLSKHLPFLPLPIQIQFTLQEPK